MLKRLLILSLIVVPFYEVFLYFFIPGRSFPEFQNMRITKDFAAMAFSIAIGSGVLFYKGFKPAKNIWILAFLLFLIFNIYKAPKVIFPIGGFDVSGMWNYKPAFQYAIYLFLCLGVSTINFSTRSITVIYKTIMYCSLMMAMYMIFQKLGMDQIFTPLPAYVHNAAGALITINGSTKNPEMGGLIGQATLCAPFVLMGIPFAVYLKRFVLVAIMATCVLLAGSSFAILGLCVLSVMIAWSKNKAFGTLIIVIGCAIGVAAALKFPDLLNNNGRYDIWHLVVDDILHGKICLSGAGIGSFPILFAVKNGNAWFSAHNDFLQFGWGCGFIGLFIAFMAVRDIFRIRDSVIFPAIVSLSVVACGTFIFQLSVYQYYLTVLIGIMYSMSEQGGASCQMKK